MTKFLTIAAALFAATACTATADTVDTHRDLASAPIECVIRTAPSAGGTTFEAVAEAYADIAGEYEFRLTREVAGNSSDIIQSGEFDLLSGDSAVLGSADLSMGRGAHYQAELVLSNGAAELCRIERRS
jgi:hypothetical protein